MKPVYYHLVTGFFIIMGLCSCKTTSPVVRVNKGKKEIKVYSSNQKASSLSRSASHSSLQKAAEVLERKLKSKPRDVDTLLDLAQVYLVQKETAKAKRTCQKALSFDLQNKRGAKLLAEIELAANNLRKAEIILYRMEGGEPKDAEVLNLLGLIALKRGENDVAFNLFKQGLKYDVDNAALRMNIGTLHMKYKQVKQAAAQFERVLRSIPDHADALLHLGVAKAYFGRTQEAQRLYSRVLDTDSSNVIARYNLALVQAKHGELRESLLNVNKALASNELTKEQTVAAEAMQTKIREDLRKQEEERKRNEQRENTSSRRGKSLAAKPLKDDRSQRNAQ